jgi:hypothetical protein
MNQCTLGKRHSWAFVKNVTTTHSTGTGFRLTKRGKYGCECGETKLGEPAYPIQYGDSQ